MTRMFARLALATSLAAAAPAAHAAVLLSNTFDAANGGVGTVNYTAFAGFTVSSGSVDLIGNGFFDFYPGHGLYVDLSGSTGAAGTLATSTVFGPGSYSVSFDLADTGRGIAGDTTVRFGAFSANIVQPAGTGFQTFRYAITLLAPAALSFTSNIPGNVGSLLDNVMVESATTVVSAASVAVPAPGALGVFLAGLAGVVVGKGHRRRRVG